MDNKTTLLIVDDERAIRNSISAYFEDFDYNVLTAENGLEALKIFQKNNVDLVISDLRMPVMDGLKLLEDIKDINPNIPLIVVSGNTDIQQVVQSLNNGAWDYILKPIENFEILHKTVERALEKSVLINENETYKKHLEELVDERTQKLKEANKMLIESERKYRLLADNVADVIWTRDLDLNLTYISPSIEKLTGYTVEEVFKMTNHERMSKETYNYAEEVLREELTLIKKGINNYTKTLNFEAELICKNGSSKWVDVHTSFIRDHTGKPIGILGSNHDITERKAYEKELEKKNEDLYNINFELTKSKNILKKQYQNLETAKAKAEQSDKLKSAFLQNISHEIRTPMNGILGFAKLLQNSASSDEDRQFYTNLIIDSGYRLQSIVNNVIELSKIETGEIKLINENIYINTFLSSIALNFTEVCKNKSIEFIVNNPVNNLTIQTDYTKLEDILHKLINNAVKFTDSGYIEIGYSELTDEIEFYVKDSGVGIDENDLDTIFESFRQADMKLSRAYEGAGIGLTIAKKFVELLGGKIRVESKVNEGSTFYFTIPYDSNIKNVEKEKEIDKSKFAKVVALIVEDDKINQMLLKKLLNSKGITVFISDNGCIAADILKINPNINIVFMDLKMPECDGYKGLSLIREFNENIPVVATTAYSDDYEIAIEKGFTEFLTKPILSNKVDDILLNLDF